MINKSLSKLETGAKLICKGNCNGKLRLGCPSKTINETYLSKSFLIFFTLHLKEYGRIKQESLGKLRWPYWTECTCSCLISKS